MNDLLVINLGVDTPIDEIKGMFADLWKQVKISKKGFVLTTAGFDDDPRELYEIPEVIEFYKKLIEIGFLSLLVPDMLDTPKDEIVGFGAFEIWMIANEIKELDNEDYKNKFFPVLMRSNEIFDQQLNTVKDGMQRYRLN